MYRNVLNGEVNHKNDVAGRLGKSEMKLSRTWGRRSQKNRNYTSRGTPFLDANSNKAHFKTQINDKELIIAETTNSGQLQYSRKISYKLE